MADDTEIWFRTEKQLLGSIFSGGDIFSAMSLISPSDFYAEPCRNVFASMIELADAGTVIDPITVVNKIISSGRKSEVTNASFVSELITGELGCGSNTEQYSAMIKGFSNKRRLSSCLKMASALSEDPTANTQEIIGSVERELSEISMQQSNDIVPIGSFSDGFYQRLEAIEKGTGIVGLPTGFSDLDMATSGYVGSELTIIAARPGMGKTAMAMESLWCVGAGKIPSLFVSLEMSGAQIYSRLACSKASVDLLRFRSGKLYENDYPKLTNAAGAIHQAPIYLADAAISGYDDLSIRGLIRKAAKKHGVKIVVIDYLQLMTTKHHRGNRQEEIGSISRGLKQLARSLDIPIIALCQLSRECEKRPDKRPILSDLRESGAIEQDGDVVIVLYRDDYYKKDSRDKGVCEAIILKQRNGPTKTVFLQFESAFARFGNLEQNRREYAPNYQDTEGGTW